MSGGRVIPYIPGALESSNLLPSLGRRKAPKGFVDDLTNNESSLMAKNKGLQAAGFQLPFILLAEDDDNDAFGMELAFHKAGLGERVRRVCDGDDAIDYLSGKSKYSDRHEFPFPSLLLLDLKMTHKDGFAVLDWARSHPRWRNIVIVVLTN